MLLESGRERRSVRAIHTMFRSLDSHILQEHERAMLHSWSHARTSGTRTHPTWLCRAHHRALVYALCGALKWYVAEILVITWEIDY